MDIIDGTGLWSITTRTEEPEPEGEPLILGSQVIPMSAYFEIIRNRRKREEEAWLILNSQN